VVFRLPAAPGTSATDRWAVDDLASLLRYRAERWVDGMSISGFLQLALHRLEIGHHAVTRTDGATLTGCWWMCRLDEPTGGRSTRATADLRSATTTLVYGRLREAGSGAVLVSTADVAEQLAATMAAISPDATVVLAVASDDEPMLEAIARAGGQRVGRVRPAVGDGRSAIADPRPPDAGADSDLEQVGRALTDAALVEGSRAG
jgi:hypothetical protein